MTDTATTPTADEATEEPAAAPVHEPEVVGKLAAAPVHTISITILKLRVQQRRKLTC